MKYRTVIAAELVAAWILVGCTAYTAPPPVPPATVEIVPRPPVSPVPLLWQPGHWDWTGSAYVWTPGQYLPAEGHSNQWMSGYWEKTDSGWVWHPAHWA
jgi:WXXGXW repeat (2 copies)